MKSPTLMQQSRIKVADIIVRDRLRPVSEAGVESLIASIAEVGVMKDAIHLRKKKDGKLHLLAGAHRVEAARRLGWEEIEAKVWTEVTDDWARLIEIDDNLAGAEMNALDTAVFLATRKEVYERLHPETRADAFKGNRHTGSLAADIMSVASFAASTAAKFGLTDRHVRRMIAAGRMLSSDQVSMLRDAKRPVTLVDLTELAKIGDAEERLQVVLKVAGGNAKSAAAARRQLLIERGVRAPAKDPDEQLLLAMEATWKRMSKALRRRWVARAFDEVSPLIADEAELRDAAEMTGGEA